jgi:hypothetical protein
MKRLKSNLMYSGLSIMLALGTATLFTGQAHAQFSSPVHDVDDPDRQPVQATAKLTLPAQFAVGSVTLTKVPPGKRLVVDFVTAASRDARPDVFAVIEIFDANGLVRLNYSLPIHPTPSGIGGASAQLLKVYAESGESIGISMANTTNQDAPGSSALWATMSLCRDVRPGETI